MSQLNLAANKIMKLGFTRGQSRQMLLTVIKENKCNVEVALYSVMRELDKIKKAGLKGQIGGERLKAKLVEVN